MTKTCENCQSFDNEKFVQKHATRDAGICTKFTEVTFKRDSCKYHLPKQKLSENEIFVPVVDVTKLPPISQLSFFQ